MNDYENERERAYKHVPVLWLTFQEHAIAWVGLGLRLPSGWQNPRVSPSSQGLHCQEAGVRDGTQYQTMHSDKDI